MQTIVRCGLLFTWLLASGLTYAQEEMIDTTIVEQIPEPDSLITTVPEKYEDKKYFQKRSENLIIQERQIPQADKQRLKDDDDFWYADTDLEKTRQQVEEERKQGEKGEKGKQEAIKENYVPIAKRGWFQTLLWILIVGGFATFLFIYLGSINTSLFRRKNRSTGTTTDEGITEDIFAINYQREIDRAVSKGNYRLAVRLQFLQLLKNMAEKNIIRYKQDKTNLDYLLELHRTNFYNPFFRVTRNYEYSWYGQFPVSKEAYGIIKNDFAQLENQLRH